MRVRVRVRARVRVRVRVRVMVRVLQVSRLAYRVEIGCLQHLTFFST